MSINKTSDNGKIILKPDGRLDTVHSALLEEAINEIDSASEIILDFELVEFISSAGLRQVVAAHKKAVSVGAEFSVINVGQQVMSILKMTGFDKKFNIG